MGRVKIFISSSCPKCPSAKRFGFLLQQKGFRVDYFDIESAEGLAEATFYNVKAVPAFLIEEEERIIGRWIGEIPSLKEIESLCGV
jgi:glutaredoxin